MAVLAAIIWLIRAHHVRLRVEGHSPLTLQEISGFWPKAAELRPDAGEKRGLHVLDDGGTVLGYVVRTAPESDSIIGYRGWTDSLIAFDPSLRVIGVALRTSQDTRDHVSDVKGDRYFMKTWNGKSWDEVAGMRPPDKEGIEGVSGASMTSLAIAEAITVRLRAVAGEKQVRTWQFQWRDAGILATVAAALYFALRGTHGRRWLRIGFQAFTILYLGFATGDLLAQTLYAGWAQSGTPWRTAPGLVLLGAAALLVPWATGKPLYCQHICPHGAVQEWLARIGPKKWRIRISKEVAAGMKWLPGLLLGVVILVSLTVLPIDLADIEPFDAYVWKSAGWATIAIAGIGLIASIFLPMAYCHYGCPTGALLNFLRSHGRNDRFNGRDAGALGLLVFAWALFHWAQPIHEWLTYTG